MQQQDMVPNPNMAALAARTRLLPVDNEDDMNIYSYAYPYFHSDGTAPVLYKLVDEFCDSSPEERTRLCKRIQSRCFVASQEEASWRDSCGDSALHRLCQCKTVTEATVFVAKSLIQACPKLVCTSNNWQETPLHQFVSHCGIIKKCDGDSKENYASSKDDDQQHQQQHLLLLEHTVDLVRLLLSYNTHVASCRNYLGAMPLHVACELSINKSSESEESLIHTTITNILLKQHSMALLAKDNEGRTPLHLATLNNNPQILELLLQELRECKMRQGKLKKLLRDLLQQLWKDDDDSSTLFHQQDAAAVASTVPWTKTVLLLKANNNIQNDLLLLHTAIEMEAPLIVLQTITHMYPQHSRVLDHNGRLPLHVALDKKMTWSNVVQTLFHAEPRSVSARDPVTFLYPFLLAAKATNPQQEIDLNTIYNLLRADPSVVAFALCQ